MGSDDLAGVIMGIWNDRLIDKEWNMVLENNFYPNMLAIAERSWRGGGTEYFDKQGTILPVDENSEVFRNFEDFESRMLWYKEHLFKGYPFAYVKQTHVKWNITDADERVMCFDIQKEDELFNGWSDESTAPSSEILPNGKYIFK